MNESNPLPLAQPVLVTGGAGFIGRHIVEQLLSRGNQAVVFDVPGAPVPPAWEGRVRLIRGDIATRGDVDRAMEGMGTVFHTAAVVSDWAPRAAYERVTLEGSRHVFEAAARNHTRVLLLSSCAVYGTQIGRQVLREEGGWGQPLGLYSEYKQKQETLGWEFNEKQGMELSVVRPSKVYGPGSKPWVREVAATLRSGKPTLVNGGNYIPGLVYVDNLVDILLRAASLPQAQGRVYNGYDGTTVTLRQYFTDLARIVGAPPPRPMPGWFARILASVIGPTWTALKIQSRPLLTSDSLRMVSSEYRISMDRVRGELGFEPRVTYDEGLHRVEAYWKSLPQPELKGESR